MRELEGYIVFRNYVLVFFWNRDIGWDVGGIVSFMLGFLLDGVFGILRLFLFGRLFSEERIIFIL